MSDSPKTRPDELAVLLNDDRAFKVYVIRSLDHLRGWTEQHQRTDEQMFQGLEKRIRVAESSAKHYEGDRNQFRGIRKALLGLVFVSGCVYAVIEFALKVITYLKGGSHG